MKKRIIVINGPNLNLLGKRQPEIYGHLSFEGYFKGLEQDFAYVDLLYFQSNHEGVIIDLLHQYGFVVDGFILNAGAYTHTSIAIADAISAITSPVVEVHISDIYTRESFRHISYMKDVCIKSIVGKGLQGYQEGIQFLIDYENK
jgi:3-dehydroquinate dehydratase II